MKKFPSIFKIPNYRRFDYEPRYYDPVKERIEEREKLIKAQMEGNQDLSMEGIRQRISFSNNRSRSQSRTSVWMRLAIVLMLSFLVYAIFQI
ncbi:hypothetical protein V6R21_27110 [Limibacter armeniacum]|uniref:hypothetical protein n=1 Tax=Limibacter armeniacum TaxID=466084 RepID=UPI002FE5FE59